MTKTTREGLAGLVVAVCIGLMVATLAALFGSSWRVVVRSGLCVVALFYLMAIIHAAFVWATREDKTT